MTLQTIAVFDFGGQHRRPQKRRARVMIERIPMLLSVAHGAANRLSLLGVYFAIFAGRLLSASGARPWRK
jgi:hypothetical protein